MRFSQRHGHNPIRQILQTTDIDKPLRTRLWNCLYIHYFEGISQPALRSSDEYDLQLWGRYWHDYLARPLDQMPYTVSELATIVKQQILAAPWYQVYDILEFVHQNDPDPSNRAQKFAQSCNVEMEKELCGFRFVGQEIAAITSAEEIQSIEQALAPSSGPTGIRAHLNSALAKLSDRKQPDYRNSIKESISAVEALCRHITSDPKATLGQALQKMKNELGIPLHPALYGAFEKLYGYTSDEGGIRHAMLDDAHISFADAKFMLVACSAFVNYALGKLAEAATRP